MTLTSKDANKVGLTKEVMTKQRMAWDSTVSQGLRTSAVMRDEVKEVVCPAFADSISEGDVRWEKAVGDSVAEDETICEIETDKTSVPVPSPAAGGVAELLAEAQHQLHHPPVGLYVRLEHLGGLYHTIPYHNIPYHTM